MESGVDLSLVKGCKENIEERVFARDCSGDKLLSEDVRMAGQFSSGDTRI